MADPKPNPATRANELLAQHWPVRLDSVQSVVSDVARMTRGDTLLEAIAAVQDVSPAAAAKLLALASRELGETKALLAERLAAQ